MLLHLISGIREMEGDSNSWIRRTKYSHTVCHRLDLSRLVSFPLHLNSDRTLERSLELKSRSPMASSRKKSVHCDIQIQRNLITNKQRSPSPLPQTVLADTFKEARSERRRFSTPNPQRKQSEKCRFFHKESHDKKGSNPATVGSSPIRHLGSMNVQDKSKNGKESTWTKYFDHSAGRINAVEAADEHTVDLSQLFYGVRFAYGAHSRLYHGVYMDERVAVKVISFPDDDNGDLGALLEKQFSREVTLLSRLHHPNVIKFVAAYRDSQAYCVMTEYLSEGSLRAYLHKLDDRSLQLQKLIAIALEVARGMEYIHSQGVIHRDLKPENILIDEEFHMKIADFGIACEKACRDLVADDPGTYRWMAPEMIKRKSYGRKVDVYSFGLILWEMVAGAIPFKDMNPIQAAFAVLHKNLRPVIPVNCPPAMRALIEQCWSLHPDKRPDFWQIVKVLEQFESSLNRDGTLNLVKNPTCQDHKKGLLRWIQKLGPVHPHSNALTKPVPKPKFT